LPYLGPASPMQTEFFFNRLWPSLIFISYFYLNYFLLIPKLFSKKNYLIFFLITLAVLFIIIYVNSIIQKPPEMHFQPDEHAPKDKPAFMYFRTIGTFFTFFLGSLALNLLESRNKREKILRDAENERVNTELSYLKHQISPHFLFNSLNSVYSLAVKKSDSTPDVVLKLSDLMRYALENKAKTVVRLEEELEHIRKYIELQKIRLFDVVTVIFDAEDYNPALKTEPMLLIPFVENAFKYGVSYHDECTIKFRVTTQGNTLYFNSENKIFKSDHAENNTGIGLKNVKRRLELLYAGNYKLDIADDGDMFKVNMEIILRN